MRRISFLIPISLLTILFISLYLPVIKELIYDWSHDDNYSHGFFIPVFSGYIIWQHKERLKNIEQRSHFMGLLVLLFGLGLYIIATASSEWFSARMSLIFVLAGLIIYLLGKEFFKSIWFPIVFLVFMIPLPYVIYYSVTFPMQLLSTKAAAMLLKVIGLPILRQGNIIYLPNYSLEVVEACSGLRSLMTLSALGAAIAYLTQKSIFSGVVLFLFSIPIAIGANIFRIFITAIGAFVISPKFAEGFLHEASGLIVFLLGFILLGITGTIIKWLGNLKHYDPIYENN